MAAPLLSIERLRVDVPGQVVLENVSLQVGEGEILGLLGPPASGKTTLLRAASGLIDLTSGVVRAGAFRYPAQPESFKRSVGFVAENAPLPARLTAAEFLDHFARAYDLSLPGWRIMECLELTWLADQRAVLCADLSHGMRQRLSIARALLADPPVLLIDAPGSCPDPLGRMDVWKLLLQLRDAGKALLASARRVEDLVPICERAVLLARARLSASTPLSQLAPGRTPRRLSVRWRGAASHAMEVLNSCGNITSLAPSDSGAQFEFEGDAESLHELLRQLIMRDIHVTEWRSLEDEALEPAPLRVPMRI
ncbi:MAG: ABC transporter ATP-binding protein [Verrucomicrobiota bacterium]